MKKTWLIITISVLVILFIASLITKYIDTANVSTGHEPECCIKIVSQDGGKVTYWGLGYKVVRYVGVSPNEPYENNIGVKMGSWFMRYENPTNVILDVKSFGGNKTFQISYKTDVDFVANLLKYSKYTDEPCDGIIDYAITYDDYTYNVLIGCKEIRKGNKQAKISDKDMAELERILVNAESNSDKPKNLYLPEAKNDKIYTTIGGGNETHQGEGYTIAVPDKNYRYEKEYDDGALEEKWEYTKKDDVEIKVTTYKNSDEISARTKFLKDYDEYIFEDLLGLSLCGQEIDGDTLWFNIHISGETVYIVSWEFPKNTSEDLQKELSSIAGTFTLAE